MSEERYFPEYPLGISVVGAPGSGKEAVVEDFRYKAADWFKEQGQDLDLIENPGNVLPRDNHIATGLYGGWREALWIFFKRLEAEEKMRLDGKSFVVSGGPLECLAHAGVGLETVMLGLQHSGLVTPQTHNDIQAYQVAIQQLTHLFAENFRYQFVFYIPYKGKVVLPGADETDDRYSQRIDAALNVLFGNFGLSLQELEGTTEEKSATMLDTVKKLMTEGVILPEAPVVGESGESPAEFTAAVEEVVQEAAEEESKPKPKPKKQQPKRSKKKTQ